MERHRRRKRLINPRLQLKFVAIFACIAAVAVLFQAMVVNRILVQISDDLPHDGDLLAAELSEVLFSGLGYTLLLLLPLVVSLGVLATFRIAGPLYRFEVYLGQLARGEEPGPCRIRRDDELHELCAAINRAVPVLKGEAPPEAPAEDERPKPPLRLVS